MTVGIRAYNNRKLEPSRMKFMFMEVPTDAGLIPKAVTHVSYRDMIVELQRAKYHYSAHGQHILRFLVIN